MTSHSAVKLLLVLVLGLPVLLAVLGWVVGLLNAMEDLAAANILRYFNTGFSVLWLVSVVGLVIAMALQTLDDSHEQ